MDLSSETARLPAIISETHPDILKDTLFDWKCDKIVKYKKLLDDSNNHVDELRKLDPNFSYITKESDIYHNLEMDSFNIEMMSKTWLIYWEIFDKFFATYFMEKQKHPLFNTFHTKEDGHTILAMNHYISNKDLAWDWYGVAIDMSDPCSLIKHNKKKWLSGIEHNRELSSANIRSFKHDFENTPIHFYTSNGGNSLSELYGEVFCGLALLGVGGNAIIKSSDIITPLVSIFYLMSLTFDNFYVYTPKVSNQVYLIGRGYRGITTNNLKKLLDWYNDLNDTIIRMSIFKRTDLSDFTERVIKVAKKITKLQINVNDRYLIVYREYNDKDITEIIKDMESIHKKYASEWIKKFHVFKLDESKEMIRNQIKFS